jgi:hypothetical protein
MQPWLMRIGGKKDGKHYRGQREGAVSENTTFYVFTHAPDGSFEAHPIKEWYNFVPRVSEKQTVARASITIFVSLFWEIFMVVYHIILLECFLLQVSEINPSQRRFSRMVK